MTEPRISVVIPAYEMKGQGVAFLKRALTSIKKQRDINPQAIEIVVSDQSEDQEIEQFCKTTSQGVQYHRTPTRRGIAAHNLNTAVALATGEYIKILFQDDVLVEDHYLSTLLTIINTEKPDGMLTGALHTTDGESFTNPIAPKKNPYFLFGNNTASSPSVITLKREVAKALLFDESLKMLFDCDFYYRLFDQHFNILIAEQIHIANGIWEGQAQHQINFQQFTKEVRYLNWKYPQANMHLLLPAYRAEFYHLHPHAQLPFSENLRLGFIDKLLYRYLSKSSRN